MTPERLDYLTKEIVLRGEWADITRDESYEIISGFAQRAAERERREAAEREQDRLVWLLKSIGRTHGLPQFVKDRIDSEVQQDPNDKWSPYRLGKERDAALAAQKQAEERAERMAEAMSGAREYLESYAGSHEMCMLRALAALAPQPADERGEERKK